MTRFSKHMLQFY